MKRRILLIYTGGTIGMGINEKTGALEPLDFTHLATLMPELKHLPEVAVDVMQFDPPIDSSDMNPELWACLAGVIERHYDSHDGFVVLHGTDTMAYTASALSFMLENLTKPVILTGSQLPMGQWRTDGKENVVTSIELAAMRRENGRPYVPEVCIYFSGRLLRGNRSTKINADGFAAFESFNHPHLCDAGVDFKFHEHHILEPEWEKPLVVHKKMDPGVIVFTLFPGLQADIIGHVLSAPKLKCIVLRTYGSGNAPQQEWMRNILHEAERRGIVVVNVSQCVSGSVAMERYDAGYHLKGMGVVSGKDSTVEAAVTKLMHLAAKHPGQPDTIRREMERSLAGEVS